ncbi:MAG TPA: hypothetical protein VE987_17530, partial [Polyangiaceae bacterium]|nr:hypothetical protein [Polyangiaceae bacterium]
DVLGRAAGTPTTGEPVAMTRLRWPPGWSRRKASLGAAAAGAVVVALAVGALAARPAPARRLPAVQSAPPAAPAQPVATASLPPLQTTEALPAPPEVSVTDLPLVREEKKSAPAATTTAGKPDCHPPYVVDAETGKKHWKVDCL